MKWTKKKLDFVKLAQSKFTNKKTITREEIKALQQETNVVWPAWLTNTPDHRIGWGIYKLPQIPENLKEV